MAATSPFVVDDLDAFDPDALFIDGRDQVVVGVKVTPVYGQLALDLVGQVVDEANERGFNLARYEPFRDDYLLCLFEQYDPDAE
ncbi:MAG TPA: hypothetical protein VHE83_02015 [Mycobacteriales bacterium]|nr:hypothetical protein [Mycobacteriales bacterium]